MVTRQGRNVLKRSNSVPMIEPTESTEKLNTPESSLQLSLPVIDTCDVHPNMPLDLYCENERCLKLVCSHCVSSHSASGHKLTTASKAAETFKDEFDGPKVSIEGQCQQIHSYIAKVNETKQSLNESCDQAIQSITNFFDTAVATFTEQKVALVEQVNQIKVSELSKLNTMTNLPSQLLSKSETMLTLLDKIINERSPQEFFKNKDKVMDDIELILKNNRSFFLSASSTLPAHFNTYIPDSTTLQALLPTKAGEIKEEKCTYLFGAGLESPSLHSINYIYCHTQSEVAKVTVKLTPLGRHIHQFFIPEFLPVLVEARKSYYIIAYQPNVRGRYNLVIEGDITIQPTCFFVPIHPEHLRKPVQTFSTNLSKCWPVATSSHEYSSELIYIGTKTDITVLNKQTGKLGGIKKTSGLNLASLKLRQVSGICVGPDGSIFKSCHNQNKVIKYNLSGERVHAFSNHDMFDGPCGIAINQNHLYICNSGRNNILVYDLNTLDFIASIGSFGNEPGHFIHCIDIAFDDNDRMYVIDTTNRVQVLDVNCIFQYYIGMKDEQHILKDPRGICIKGDYVYVTEKEASRVSVFSLDGQLVSHIGEGYLQSPCGIAVDLDGFVWVCDWEKEAVLVF